MAVASSICFGCLGDQRKGGGGLTRQHSRLAGEEPSENVSALRMLEFKKGNGHGAEMRGRKRKGQRGQKKEEYIARCAPLPSSCLKSRQRAQK
ncbi:hypothetical protein Baya_13219 [Bagarius yarrelli]|uniref:Uncharacterized protein n=1 Tax=Bagarius yarrelli TaxID=175774 RepID=A0A556V532_BAGYA|nr:hypothetical protein Baya_13219 [Bagarius yarrelli]